MITSLRAYEVYDHLKKHGDEFRSRLARQLVISHFLDGVGFKLCDTGRLWYKSPDNVTFNLFYRLDMDVVAVLMRMIRVDYDIKTQTFQYQNSRGRPWKMDVFDYSHKDDTEIVPIAALAIAITHIEAQLLGVDITNEWTSQTKG